MTKTVMQALIEMVRAQQSSIGTDESEYRAYQAILNDAEEMIKQEREQIEGAYKTGVWKQIAFSNAGESLDMTESYYNQTFG